MMDATTTTTTVTTTIGARRGGNWGLSIQMLLAFVKLVRAEQGVVVGDRGVCIVCVFVQTM